MGLKRPRLRGQIAQLQRAHRHPRQHHRALVIGDDMRRPTIGQAAGQRIVAKEFEQWHRNRAHAPNGDMRRRRQKRLRQQHAHPVARGHAACQQPRLHPPRQRLQPGIIQPLQRRARGIDQGHLPRRLGRPGIAGLHRHVQHRRQAPVKPGAHIFPCLGRAQHHLFSCAILTRSGAACAPDHAIEAIISRPISMRRISDVPAPISINLASRKMRPTGLSDK